ncbi:MAG: GNAT family N-acetyltransferase [Syntrophaceae bacterium]|nr:GNAT family N-acetyltransferase [Syntrophaceae bacterium]
MRNLESVKNNYFAVGRYWGRLNSSFLQKGSICSMHTGVAISDFNWAWNEKPLDNSDIKSVEDIKEFYRQQKLRFWWWVYPRYDSSQTKEILENAGMRLITQIPCMAADLHVEFLEEKILAPITIAEVKDQGDLSVWADISFRGFQMPERAREQYNDFVLSFTRGSQAAQKLLLACWDGRPVATSLLFMNKDTAGIYYVATLPEYRNRGLGFYVTLAAMRAAKDAGYDNIILQATPAGAKVYRRIGFQEICQAKIYKLK